MVCYNRIYYFDIKFDTKFGLNLESKFDIKFDIKSLIKVSMIGNDGSEEFH